VLTLINQCSATRLCLSALIFFLVEFCARDFEKSAPSCGSDQVIFGPCSSCCARGGSGLHRVPFQQPLPAHLPYSQGETTAPQFSSSYGVPLQTSPVDLLPASQAPMNTGGQ